MAVRTYAEAHCRSLIESTEADERIVFMPAAFGGLGPEAVHYRPFLTRCADRMYETPISEMALCGMAVGAAMAGLRPVIGMNASFLYQGIAQVVNEAANVHYMTHGKTRVPVVFHVLQGLTGGEAAQHSRTLSSWLWNAPGLEIVLPASPRDAAGLWKTAVRSDNPTVFIGHRLLLSLAEEVPDSVEPIPFGQARVRREGTDVTVVGTSVAIPRALEAAERLARDHGVSAEVVDPRTLVPLDREAIFASVRRTGLAVVADETFLSCGVTAELAALIQEACWADLEGPVRRVALADVPIPFSPVQEREVTPTADKIVRTVLEMLSR